MISWPLSTRWGVEQLVVFHGLNQMFHLVLSRGRSWSRRGRLRNSLHAVKLNVPGQEVGPTVVGRSLKGTGPSGTGLHSPRRGKTSTTR